MTDLQFLLESGESVPTSADGVEAVLVGEFNPWVVRWTGVDRGPPFARMGSTSIRLVPSDSGYELPLVGRGRKAKPTNVRFAGVVTLYADERLSHVLSPSLRVEPANLSPADFEAIIGDLRTLAVELSAYLKPRVAARGRSSNDGTGRSLLAEWMSNGIAARECLRIYESQLPRIAVNPSRALRRRVQHIPVEHAMRRGLARLVQRRPESARHIAAPVAEYTLDTDEARFVEASHGLLRLEAAAFAALIRRRIRDVESLQTEVAESLPHLNLRARRPPTLSPIESLTRATALADELERLASDVSHVTRAPLQHEALRVRTNRLLMSAEYQPVVHAWEAYTERVDLRHHEAELLTQLDEDSLSNTATLYELWVTTRIYAALVERGFSPPGGESSLLDRLNVDTPAVELRGAGPLQLERTCAGRRVVVTLQHEPRVHGGAPPSYREPDLVLCATANGRTERWVFDAKYKNYSLPAPTYQATEAREFGSHFNADLVGVAELKYRQWIEPSVAVSGIIHPDLRPTYTFWDPLLTGGSRPERCTSPTPHSLLAFGLRPGALGDANVTTLMRLLLGYRLSLTSTCWRCGSESRRVAIPSRGTGHECEGCGSTWIVHWCKQCGHEPLLKFGAASFHVVEPPPDTFNVHCPRCNDYFRERRDLATRVPSPDDPF